MTFGMVLAVAVGAVVGGLATYRMMRWETGRHDASPAPVLLLGGVLVGVVTFGVFAVVAVNW